MDLISLNLSTPQALAFNNESELAAVSGLLIGTQTNSGQAVSPETAMRASASLACLRILMEDISQLPLRLHRQGPRGATLATDHPLYRLLDSSPNHWQTSMEMREGMVLDMLLNGTAFVEKAIGRNGIEALYPLAASRMLFRDVLADGTARWLYSPPPNNTPMLPVPGTTGALQNLRVLLADDLWRVNLMAPTGYIEGRSLILLAREAIGLALAAEEQGARLFSNGLQTSVIFKAPEQLDEDGRTQLKAALTHAYSGTSNFWKPLVLEGGLDVSKIGLTAQESQYIEARQFQLQDIARIFRIPSVMLGISDKQSTHSSSEEFFRSYVKFTIQPWVRRIEQTISRDLLAPSESDLYAKHSLDGLLRADLKSRYDAHKVGIESGFLTRNEARAIEDLPLLDGLDSPVLALNMGTNAPPSPTTPEPADQTGETEAKLSRMAQCHAANVVSHEMRLLSDGKPRAEVYAKLAGYIAAKTGLSAPLCEEYCRRRAAQTDSTEAEGIEMLKSLLLTGHF